MKGGIKMAKDKKKKETDEKREDEVGEGRAGSEAAAVGRIPELIQGLQSHYFCA